MTYWLTFAAPDGDERIPQRTEILFGYVEDRIDRAFDGTAWLRQRFGGSRTVELRPVPGDDEAEVSAWTGPVRLVGDGRDLWRRRRDGHSPRRHRADGLARGGAGRRRGGRRPAPQVAIAPPPAATPSDFEALGADEMAVFAHGAGR